MTATTTHNGLACTDSDALAAENLAEYETLRADYDTQSEELRNLRAVVATLRAKVGVALDADMDALESQIRMLHDELEAAEKQALPMGVAAWTAIETAEITEIYRDASGVRSGPLPDSITTAVVVHEDEIRAAMHLAGRQVIERVVMREVITRSRNGRRGHRPAARRSPAARRNVRV